MWCKERKYSYPLLRIIETEPSSMSSDTGRALIDRVSGGVCIGFRSEALAVEHFQKGVRGGTVAVRRPASTN